MSRRRARVAVAECNRDRIAWLRACLVDTEIDAEIQVDLVPVSGAAELAVVTAAGSVDAVIVGTDLEDTTQAELVTKLLDGSGSEAGPVFSLTNPRSAQRLQVPGLFYQLDRRLPPEQVRRIVVSALSSSPASPDGLSDLSDTQAATAMSFLLGAAREFAAQSDLSEAADKLERAIMALTASDRASCLFHDPDDGSLRSETRADGDDEDLFASSGLAGFAVRTGLPVTLARAADDARYDRAVDDPDGHGNEAIMVRPVVSDDGIIHAVLIAVRESRPYTPRSNRSLSLLAAHLGPLMHQMALRIEADAFIQQERGQQRAYDLFRAEALEAYLSRGKQGDVVRVSPSWVRWIYWPLLALLIASAVFLVVGRINEFSTGAAVIRTSGRSEVSAAAAGTVVAVEVHAGQAVRRAQILARLDDAGEADELARLENELHTQLRNRLLDPADAAAAAAVRSLRSTVESARAQRERRLIRAPRDGTVSDVRIRVGQHLSPGDLVVSLLKDATRLKVMALLPGADLPQLRPGMPLRLELDGYRYAYQRVTIDSIGEEVIGPAEARRYLGARIADGIVISGPVVVVEASLPSPTFEADDEVYKYHDGMLGLAEAKVRSKRIIEVLIPQLEQL